jgi:hypothetical protein
VSNKIFIFFKLLTFGAAATPKLANWPIPNGQGIYSSFRTLHHIGGILFIYIKDFFASILVIFDRANLGSQFLDMNSSPTGNLHLKLLLSVVIQIDIPF